MISVCVQHHPKRTYLLPRLMDRLGEFELITDPDPDGVPSPLRTYRECLRSAPVDATHLIVIQDDAWPCEGFREKAESAIAERPDTVVCFFVPGIACAGARRMAYAASQGERWAEIGGKSVLPLVATCWPAPLIEPFLVFSLSPRYRDKLNDDSVASAFLKMRHLDVWRENKREVWATVPSIVEHPDREPSLVGKMASDGRNRARVALISER